jgi:hypothetical protein
MRRPRRSSLVALVLGVALGWAAGCDPGNGDGFGDTPPPLSERVCYGDEDCTANRCCGLGTNPTHVLDGPDCGGVRCDGSCPPGSIDCGRCIPVCRDSRCEAACTG